MKISTSKKIGLLIIISFFAWGGLSHQWYTMMDTTWEIILMLLIAFMLGWAFHYFWGRLIDFNLKAKDSVPERFSGISRDDLKLIEGVGPKIEELLKANGIKSWDDIAAAEIVTLKSILMEAGDRFQMHDPSSWADQAALASESKWSELQEYQDLLIGGRAS